MVEYGINLDTVFSSLADPTRRDILQRVTQQPLSISDIAAPYKISFAAVAKHICILESAKLISKKRQGKQQIIKASPQTIQAAAKYLEIYKQMWEERFSALDNYLEQTN